MDEYKGMFYGETTTLKYYEGGAHFRYKDLYTILQRYSLSLSPSITNNTSSYNPSLTSYTNNPINDDDRFNLGRSLSNNHNRQSRNIKSMQHSLTHQLEVRNVCDYNNHNIKQIQPDMICKDISELNIIEEPNNNNQDEHGIKKDINHVDTNQQQLLIKKLLITHNKKKSKSANKMKSNSNSLINNNNNNNCSNCSNNTSTTNKTQKSKVVHQLNNSNSKYTRNKPTFNIIRAANNTKNDTCSINNTNTNVNLSSVNVNNTSTNCNYGNGTGSGLVGKNNCNKANNVFHLKKAPAMTKITKYNPSSLTNDNNNNSSSNNNTNANIKDNTIKKKTPIKKRIVIPHKHKLNDSNSKYLNNNNNNINNNSSININNSNINNNDSHNTNKSISKICNKVSMNIVNVNYRKQRNLSNSNKNQKRNKSITFSNTNTTKQTNNNNNIETNCSNVVVTTTTNTTLANNSISHNNNNNSNNNTNASTNAGCTRTRALSGGGTGINKSRNKRLVIRSDVINNNATVNVISNHKLNKQKMMNELFQTNQNVLCKRGLPLSKFSPNRKGNNCSTSGNKMKVVNITVTEPNHSSNLKTKNKTKGIIRPKSKGKLSIDMGNTSLTNHNEKVHTNIMKRK